MRSRGWGEPRPSDQQPDRECCHAERRDDALLEGGPKGFAAEAGSAPAAELAETSAKFRTFLAALGLDPAVAVDPSAVRAK